MNQIAIIDYGVGNLHSVQKALEKVGGQTFITNDPKQLTQAQKIVLPGVGAIKPAIEKLTNLRLVEPIKKAITQDKPFLGICLGLQLLFEKSFEDGEVTALGVLGGDVQRFEQLKVPHMGWNELQVRDPSNPLFLNVPLKASVYFCHSYYVVPSDKSIVSSTTEYGINFVSSITRGRLFGVQFHPEKSQTVGLKILENFVQNV